MRVYSAPLLLATASLAAAMRLAPEFRPSLGDLVKRQPAGASTTITCPSGKFNDGKTKACKDCSASGQPHSETCTATAALSCKTKWFLHNGACGSSCPSSTWASSAAKACISCTTVDSDAATCTSTAAISCNTKFFSNGKCLDTCPTGQFGDASSHTCKTCLDADAATCTSTAATSCKTLLLQGGACVETCAGATFPDTTNHVCTACADSNAATCSSSAALSCTNEYYLQNGACTQICSGASYPDDATRSCIGCSDPDASSCTSTAATSCNTLYLKDGACTGDCGDGLFADESNHICSSCSSVDADAATCTSIKATSCKTLYLTNDGRCSEDCDDGYYEDDATKTCIACADGDALSCTAVEALSCKTLLLQGGACVETCAGATYPDSESSCRPSTLSADANSKSPVTATDHVCTACKDDNAATCSSSAALSCNDEYYLQNGGCTQTCQGASYPDGTNKACIACSDPQAATCSFSASLTCTTGFVLNDGICVTDCPSDTYLDANGACASCSAFPDAATCNSNGALTCVTSGNGAVNGICVAGNAYALYPGYIVDSYSTGWDYYQYRYQSTWSHAECEAVCQSNIPGSTSSILFWNNLYYNYGYSWGYCFCIAADNKGGAFRPSPYTGYTSAAQLKGTCASLSKDIPSCIDVTFVGNSCIRTSDGSNCDYLY